MMIDTASDLIERVKIKYTQDELESFVDGIRDAGKNMRLVHQNYADNKDNMDEDTLARLDMMKQKYDLQEQANNDFKQGMDYAKNIGGQVEDALIDYSNVQGYDEAQINTLWNELNPDSDIEKTIEEKRNDLRANRMDSVKELTDVAGVAEILVKLEPSP